MMSRVIEENEEKRQELGKQYSSLLSTKEEELNVSGIFF
jgi:hypothetical protein